MATIRKKISYKSVEEYFDSQPEDTKETLLAMKAIIIETVTDTEELINYDIPAYTMEKGGKRDKQIMIAGYKNFVGFYVGTNILQNFDKELTDYKVGKASVQFPNNKSLPKNLIVKIIKFKIQSIK
jgi:uncharacterized protein YdhG (YjbR/CyaY superfamily)